QQALKENAVVCRTDVEKAVAGTAAAAVKALHAVWRETCKRLFTFTLKALGEKAAEHARRSLQWQSGGVSAEDEYPLRFLRRRLAARLLQPTADSDKEDTEDRCAADVCA